VNVKDRSEVVNQIETCTGLSSGFFNAVKVKCNVVVYLCK